MGKFLELKSNPSKGEVFTPTLLVSEMLDKIPDDFWKNPNAKFLDPSIRKGTFLIEIVRRLVYIYGYTETDAKSRVYGYDTRVKYINHLKRRGFVNVRHKDFLNEEINMKFDVIVGNPPFQKALKSGKKSVDTLWAKFIQKSFEIVKEGGIVSLVSPDGWCSPTFDIPSGEVSIFRDYFKVNNLTYVATNNKVKPYFKNIGTSFTYFVCEKSNYKNRTIFDDGSTLVEFNILPFNFIPKKIDNISISIHEKLLNGGNKFIFERYRKKDGGMLDDRHPHFSTPKLKFSRGIAIFNVSADNGTAGYDVFTYAYHLQDGETIESGLSVLNSKAYKFVLNQKWNQYFTKYIPNMVKKPELNKIYSDSEIYQFLELTQEEINYVESNIG